MNLHRDILRLAVPSILANITVPLVGMVDIAVAGHLGASGSLGAAALIGGISIGTMLFDMLYWNFGFLRGGTGGLTAQAYGRHRAGVEEAAGDIAVTLKRALSIALGSGLVMVALQWVVVQVAFLLVKCTPEVQTLATQYFYIRIWAAPATLSLFAFKGWFIGMQPRTSSCPSASPSVTPASRNSVSRASPGAPSSPNGPASPMPPSPFCTGMDGS